MHLLGGLSSGLKYRHIGLPPRIACSGKIGPMTSLPNLDHLPPEQLRALAAQFAAPDSW